MLMFWISIAGFIGGTMRGLFGFLKHQMAYRKAEFNLWYFLMIVLLSGIIGLTTAYAFGQNALFAFVVGYAGGDFIENVYKTIKHKI